MKGEEAAVRWLVPDWPVTTRVHAAVSLRGGGVSRAPYESLNLASHVGDDPAAVQENRRRLCGALGLAGEPRWLSQVHGRQVLTVQEPAQAPAALAPAARGVEAPAPPQADAAVTRRVGCPLGVLVADCLPVLLASEDGETIGIAHAGWRGLAAGVLEAVIAAMRHEPAQLHAWLGPAIGQAHFEVGAEVRAALCETDPGADGHFQANARGRWQCDLHGLVARRLAGLGVRSLHGQRRCTYAQPQVFFSYRREGVTGRMAALIWLA